MSTNPASRRFPIRCSTSSQRTLGRTPTRSRPSSSQSNKPPSADIGGAGNAGLFTRRKGVMGLADKLVLNRQRHLKWKALDRVEMILMIICGLTLFGFSMSVCADITTRIIGRPWLWLQEVTSTLFIYGIFIGAAVATRRNDHLYLTAVAESMHG